MITKVKLLLAVAGILNFTTSQGQSTNEDTVNIIYAAKVKSVGYSHYNIYSVAELTKKVDNIDYSILPQKGFQDVLFIKLISYSRKKMEWLLFVSTLDLNEQKRVYAESDQTKFDLFLKQRLMDRYSITDTTLDSNLISKLSKETKFSLIRNNETEEFTFLCTLKDGNLYLIKKGDRYYPLNDAERKHIYSMHVFDENAIPDFYRQGRQNRNRKPSKNMMEKVSVEGIDLGFIL